MVEEGAEVTGIEEGYTKKHDLTICVKCRFWSSNLGWCNYGEIMNSSRLKDGGKLFPTGGCRLYEPREPGNDTQMTLQKKWGSQKQGKAPPDKLPESVFKQMDVLYAEGKSDPEIAKELGVGHTSVARWRKRNNLESNYTKRMRERS